MSREVPPTPPQRLQRQGAVRRAHPDVLPPNPAPLLARVAPAVVSALCVWRALLQGTGPALPVCKPQSASTCLPPPPASHTPSVRSPPSCAPRATTSYHAHRLVICKEMASRRARLWLLLRLPSPVRGCWPSIPRMHTLARPHLLARPSQTAHVGSRARSGGGGDVLSGRVRPAWRRARHRLPASCHSSCHTGARGGGGGGGGGGGAPPSVACGCACCARR